MAENLGNDMTPHEYKGYQITSSNAFTMKVIKPIGKGTVSKELQGLYTSTAEAEKVIDRFLAAQETRNAKTNKST
jgi:hypothetical protein